MKVSEPVLIVITGPTASGKSALAVELARSLGTEIINADSRQVFTGIPVVTAMPRPEELAAVPHHLLDFLPLDAYYSAAMFADDALPLAAGIIARTGSAIVCGGSMLYIDALCNGIDCLPTVPTRIREVLRLEVERNGYAPLLEELRLHDPEYYRRVDLNNLKRVFHAVEIMRTAGRSYTSMLTGAKRKLPWKVLKICLSGPREELFYRINRRVDRMVGEGLEEEARRVFPLCHLNSLNTVGLKEMFAFFNGQMDRTTAIERIKKNTRVYAKKQITWWRRDADVIWVDFTSPELPEQVFSFLS